MRARTLAGPEAASLKYDLLTALGCHALGGAAGTQRMTLRFITLVTARYDWRRGILHVGQREIARLWAVDERTVKREMARFRDLGWITLETPARRGRVASYALDLERIRAATREAWPRVGSDFDARMRALADPGGGANVVPFPRADAPAPEEEAGTAAPWAAARRLLRDEDPALFANWFEPLRAGGESAGALVLVAPNSFHASHVRTHYADRLGRALRGAGLAEAFRLVAEGAAESAAPR
ncbi:DnaA N-terminal domain-containing protein [Amaricoccus solimangrovi]|uniref:DnaA N-terminal domain-containing protein n=1 Tax=Amaricoccus solimangrovi TaxID=2589815 RepID=A0A501WSH7_9RHOB|nr:DnaA N-terminal domain-containing protein [Amaricoccus solimangrovi]TPE51044.1 hypothetical protein FJM51_10450 [Amaricoccus solimangrovi]